MATSLALPDARRIRSYLLRLPLTTRGILFALTAFYVAHLFSPGLEQWGALIPQEIDLNSLYRLNTYPLLHKSLFHYLLNTLSLIPLLDRFEAEHGTIVTLILFTGPFGLLPGLLYTLVERYVLFTNTAAVGASVWIFLLLANEALKTSRANPHFTLRDFRVPTWTAPLLGIFLIAFLLPHTSFLGHCSGAAVGYLWGLGWIRFLAPHDRILRWIEGKLNLLGRLPHYVSVDQKTYGRYGVLPSTSSGAAGSRQGGGFRPLSPAAGGGGGGGSVGGATGLNGGLMGKSGIMGPSGGQRLGP